MRSQFNGNWLRVVATIRSKDPVESAPGYNAAAPEPRRSVPFLVQLGQPSRTAACVVEVGLGAAVVDFYRKP